MTHDLVALPADNPVHDAIAAHRAAYDAFQVAPEGEAALLAEDAYDAASMALVAVVCATTPEALALFRHLAWWVLDEAENASGHQPAYDIARARARDLAFYAGDATPLIIPTQLPPRRGLPPMRRPISLRRAVVKLVPMVGDTVFAIAIVAGGAVLTAYASLL